MKSKVIAAVKGDINAAVRSNVDMIFLLNPNIMNIGEVIGQAHKQDKKIFLHFDLAEGIGKDEAGLNFIKSLGADGIISTRVNIIKSAKKCGLDTVQRFFIVDSQSVKTTVEAIKASKPDMIELMPGTLAKIIEKVKSQVQIPLIAGGLIETYTEVLSAISAGAAAVSTTREELWKIKDI